MSADENKALITRLVDEVLNSGRLDNLDQFLDAQVIVHDPIVGDGSGLERFAQVLALFNAAFPGHHTAITQLVAEGDAVAMLHVHEATNTGSFMGMPPTGRRVPVNGLELYRIADGKVVESWRHDDDAGLLQQLGIMPTPGAA